MRSVPTQQVHAVAQRLLPYFMERASFSLLSSRRHCLHGTAAKACARMTKSQADLLDASRSRSCSRPIFCCSSSSIFCTSSVQAMNVSPVVVFAPKNSAYSNPEDSTAWTKDFNVQSLLDNWLNIRGIMCAYLDRPLRVGCFCL